MSVTFVESKREAPRRNAGRTAAPSPLADDVRRAIETGKVYETRVSNQDLADGVRKELERAARQVREVIDGIERPATVKVWFEQAGKQVVVAWFANAPKAAAPKQTGTCPRCGREVTVNADGKLRSHKNDGNECE